MMDLQPHDKTSIVVAEHGAEWATWVIRFEVATPDVVVLRQAANETIASFATRVRDEVAMLESLGHDITRAVVVGGDQPDTLAARILTIRALLAPMIANGEGTLLLDGMGRDRFAMRGLASTLSSQIHGTGVLIRAIDDAAVASVA